MIEKKKTETHFYLLNEEKQGQNSFKTFMINLESNFRHLYLPTVVFWSMSWKLVSLTQYMKNCKHIKIVISNRVSFILKRKGYTSRLYDVSNSILRSMILSKDTVFTCIKWNIKPNTYQEPAIDFGFWTQLGFTE